MAVEESVALGRSNKRLLDRKEALERVGDDAAILVTLLDLLAEELPAMLSAIREAVMTENAPELNRTAHRLKGSISVFGAEATAEAALALEAIGRSGNLANAKRSFRELEQEIARLQPELLEFRKQLLSSGTP